MSSVSYIKTRLFITLKFNNEEIGYSKLTIPEKFNFISDTIYKNIKLISKTLKITSIDFEKSTPFTNIVYFVIYTLPNRNHPIIGYVSRGNSANEIVLVRPIGRKRYNLAIEQLDVYLHRYMKHSLQELYAIYLSIIKSIIIRKEELLLNDEFSLLNCHNIKGCITATKKVNNTTLKTKKAIIQSYRNKGITIIKKYFTALEKYNFTEAEIILGSSKYIESPINTVFRKTKKIRGHLEIFIVLYKLIKSIEIKYNFINNKQVLSKRTPKLKHNTELKHNTKLVKIKNKK